MKKLSESRGLMIVYMVLVMISLIFMVPEKSHWKIARGYSLKFEAGAEVSGIFKKMSANIIFDESDLENASVSVIVKTESINTGNGMMNNHAKGEKWFNSKEYPEIIFTASTFTKTTEGYLAKGTLQIKDVKKEISIPFTYTRKEKSAEVKTVFSIDRTEYNVGKPSKSVDSKVKLNITLPLTK